MSSFLTSTKAFPAVNELPRYQGARYRHRLLTCCKWPGGRFLSILFIAGVLGGDCCYLLLALLLLLAIHRYYRPPRHNLPQRFAPSVCVMTASGTQVRQPKTLQSESPASGILLCYQCLAATAARVFVVNSPMLRRSRTDT
jgi:hypothetical protein